VPTEVELLRVEQSERAKARAFWRSGIWLKISVAFQGECYIDSKATKICCHIPSSRCSSVLYRIVAASGSLPQQNFDYANRFAVFFAQNDIQQFYLIIIVRYFAWEERLFVLLLAN
jgi:hypothetical protein